MSTRYIFAVCGLLLLLSGPVGGAKQSIYGLQSVKFERVYDPNARPIRLRLVSGILKLTGGHSRTNMWEAVTFIPRATAAPKSDYGIYWQAGDRLMFYSLLTFSSYSGRVAGGGEWLVIEKVNRYGQSQTEVWYFSR